MDLGHDSDEEEVVMKKKKKNSSPEELAESVSDLITIDTKNKENKEEPEIKN